MQSKQDKWKKQLSITLLLVVYLAILVYLSKFIA